jgi:hypothetical protein
VSLRLTRSELEVVAGAVMPAADGTLWLGDYRIDPKDMCSLVLYFLTNTDLTTDDPRRELVRAITRFEEVRGWNPAGMRFCRSS